MDDKTTTEAPAETGGQIIQGVQVDDQGTAVPQPVVAEPAEAAQEPAQPTKTTQEAPQEDNAEWLKSKGIDLSTPEGQDKLAKSYRELEKGFHEKSQKASELEKASITGFDEAVKEDVSTGALEADDPRIAIRKLEIKNDVRDFFDANPEAKTYEKEMINVVAEKPHLRGDLEAIYAIALKNNVSGVKSEGAKEALENLAAKQSATAPKGNATNGSSFSAQTKITHQNVNDLVKANDMKWFIANQEAINKAIAG